MLKRNLIANYLGQGWSALMGLAFIPIYIKYLGIEAYGLIGLFTVLQAWLSLLDMGMTPTLNREMARFTAGAHSATFIRDLLRSIEIIAIGTALLGGLGIWAASGWLASDWLRAERLTVEVVAQAFSIMGAVTALRFVEGIYRSSIIGLQRQVLFNVLNSVLATLRSVGAVGILNWISPSIEAFFLWQGLISLIALVVFARVTYHNLPIAERRGRFSMSALRGIGRFAGGMMGISFLTVMLTQVDKILLSKLLNLSEYGYYTLATVVAGTLYMLTGPITQTWFPRLSQLCVEHNEPELIRKYHQGAQLVSVFMGSAAFIMMAYSPILLELWTHDAELAQRSAQLLTLLALGALLNGLMWIPYQSQLAHGWTRLAIWQNVAAVIFIIPAILYITPRYGTEGAAWIWVVLNTGNLFVGIQIMHRKILINEKWRWYSKDVFQPLLAAGIVASFTAWIMPHTSTVPCKLLFLILASFLTLLAAALAAPTLSTELYKLGKWIRRSET